MAGIVRYAKTNHAKEAQRFRERIAKRVELAKTMGIHGFIAYSEGHDLIETAHCVRVAFNRELGEFI